jgi:hypothetical protein
VPGQTYAVVVGQPGQNGFFTTRDSYFISPSVVAGLGGANASGATSGVAALGGGFIGSGGGNGGNGGWSNNEPNKGSGGGGGA